MADRLETGIGQAALRGYSGDRDKPFFLILPGGAYAACAEGEGEPVAAWLSSLGYSAYVLNYATLWPSFPIERGSHPRPGPTFPTAMRQVGEAIHLLRSDAAFGSNGKCVLCGFSAGGHLAASYGNGWEELQSECGTDIRPDALLLCYAVTRLRQEPNVMMNRAIFGTGDRPDEAEVRQFSPVFHVNSATPPTFLWHTVTDEMVPVEQTIHMAEALQEARVPFEFHVYSQGPHASALAQGLPAENWKREALRFISELGL